MKYFLNIIFVSVLIYCIPANIFAASVYFDPHEQDVGTSTPFLVGINIDADQSVNTVSFEILFSPELEPVDVSDGNSIINTWIDKPVFDPHTHIMKFSGLIPGGYSGKGGRVLTVSVRALGKGRGVVQLGSKSKIYLNGPDGVEDPLSSLSAVINIDSARNNIPNHIVDNIIPEDFKPELVSLYYLDSTTTVLVFDTQDKGSGVDHYEVKEHDLFFGFSSRGWNRAESPYVVSDQGLHDDIDVRAYDKNNNFREKTVLAKNSYWFSNILFGVVLVLLVGLTYIFI
jgi:hypothetical protein